MSENTKSENEKKKDYLKAYLPTVKAVNRIELEIEELRTAKMNPSVSYDDMPHGTDQKDLSDYIVSLERLTARLIKAKTDRINKYVDLFEKIETMENETEKEILKARYLQGMKWEDICCEFEKSWRNIHRIHSDALNNFKML